MKTQIISHYTDILWQIVHFRYPHWFIPSRDSNHNTLDSLSSSFDKSLLATQASKKPSERMGQRLNELLSLIMREKGEGESQLSLISQLKQNVFSLDREKLNMQLRIDHLESKLDLIKDAVEMDVAVNYRQTNCIKSLWEYMVGLALLIYHL